ALIYGAYLLLAGADFSAWITHHFIRLHSLEEANADMLDFSGLLQSSEAAHYLFGGLLVFMGLVLVGVALSGFRMWFQEKEAGRLTALLLGLLVLEGILLMNQVRLGLKFIRLSQVAPPLYMGLAFLLQALFNRLKARAGPARLRWLAPGAALAFAVFLAGYIWTFEGSWSQDSFAVRKLRPHYLDLPRGGCYFKGKKGQEIEEVVRFLEQKTEPGEPIFTGPSCPLFHFLAGRANPTPFTDFTFYYFNEDNQRIVIDALEEAGVEYVVNWPRPLTGFLFMESAPLLTGYLNSHFARERNIGRFVILKRK
ncbi:MAG: hypothetical protein ACYTG7_20645, partial [Planctomycetota bacterium]